MDAPGADHCMLASDMKKRPPGQALSALLHAYDVRPSILFAYALLQLAAEPRLVSKSEVTTLALM